MLDLTQRALVDGIDQSGHAGVERGGFLDAGVLADPSLRGVFSGAALGDVDHIAGEQCGAGGAKTRRLGQAQEPGDMRRIQMGFRPVEPHPAISQRDMPGQLADARIIGGE